MALSALANKKHHCKLGGPKARTAAPDHRTAAPSASVSARMRKPARKNMTNSQDYGPSPLKDRLIGSLVAGDSPARSCHVILATAAIKIQLAREKSSPQPRDLNATPFKLSISKPKALDPKP